ncbi:hypothetical protein Gpo141_00011539 [Globisporangium polare]
MAATTPVSNYAAQGSPNDVPSQDDGAPAHNGGSSELGKSAFHRLARAWFAIRWRLAETVFARPLPWVTANLELKLGDLILTLPVAVGFLAWNAWLCYQVQVKESGTPASLMMLLVFALTVRNNSILLSLTGLPYERALLYHKFFGVVAILVVGLHGLAYLRESAGVSVARRQRRRLAAMGRNNDAPGATTDTSQAPTFTPQFSGAIIFYMLIALFVLSLNPIRRRFYELFLRSHVLLFLGIIVFSAIHGAGLVLVGAGIWAVDMVFRHGYVAPKYQKGSPASCGATAKRMGVLAKEQILMAKLPGDIVRIQFPKVRADTGACFHYEAGQYVFVCVPRLGYLEWHPFTISSSPHEAFVTIHVKALGDWTKRLMQQVSLVSGTGTPVPAPFSVLFDGPYGQVSLDITSPKTYAHFALFSGGIGITPMQAIANQLHYEYHHDGRHAIKKVRFVWSVRDRATIQALFNRDFVEFKKQQIGSSSPYSVPYLPDSLLSSAANEPRDVFFTEFFLTKGASEPENPVDQLLQHCLRYNTRPRIRETLQSVGEDAKAANKRRVAVLVCGPAVMVKEVVTEALSLSREMKIRFDVHTESFDF